MNTGLFGYVLLNLFFHVLHLGIILFVMLGWLVPALLPLHLALLVATLGSWFVLGHWLGRGYCPISAWHWRIKQRYGPGRPDGTYIHLILESITGRQLDSARIDRTVVLTTVLLGLLSAVLNLTSGQSRLFG